MPDLTLVISPNHLTVALKSERPNLLSAMLKVIALNREQVILAVAAFALTLFVVAQPAHAASFSINISDMMDSAADIFNGLWPAFAIVVGLGLGVQILRFIVSAVKSAF